MKSYLKRHRELVGKLISNYLDNKQSTWGKTDIELEEFLNQIKEYVLRGGKFSRSALVRLANSLVGGSDDESVLAGAAGFELIHKFILVHDDIFDQDMVRYSGPTLEAYYKEMFEKRFGNRDIKVYDKGMAIVGGDLIHVLANQLILESKLDSRIKVEAIKAINICIAETAAGWKIHANQNFESISESDKENYLKGMELVSAMYSVIWPLRLGQLYAGKKEGEWLQPIEDYGYNVGIAFQIRDDILGMFGDKNVTGKPVGNDFREGKKTLLIFEAYEKASKKDKAFIETSLGVNVDEESILQVQEIIRKTGALNKANDKAMKHAQLGVESLNKLGVEYDQDSIRVLKELAVYLVEREY